MMYTYGCENSNVYGYGIYICMDGIVFQLQHDSEDHPGEVLYKNSMSFAAKKVVGWMQI